MESESTLSFNYCPSTPSDRLIEHIYADKRENGLAKLCKDSFEKKESPAKVALRIVTEWLSFQPSCRISDTTVTLSGSLKSSGLDEKHTKILFWENVFSEGCNLPEHWTCLFRNRKYKDIVDGIPDDRVCRMVFHFVHQWQDRLGSLLVDKDVPCDLKVTVLKKQIGNIVFFGQGMCSGSLWHMWSLADEPLRQALASPGSTVSVKDQEGEPLTDIQGRKVTATADPRISSSSGNDPRPDDLDKILYKRVRSFAEKKTGGKIPNQWTLVRCRFVVSQGRETRCYAFSGTNPEKQLNKIPEEFWKQHKFYDPFFKADRDLFLVNVQGRQFGQRVLLSVFEALLPSIKTDLYRLTNSICFEEKSDAQELITCFRSDLAVVDYGEYYDCVIAKLNYCDDCIKKAVTNYLTKQSPGSDVKNLVCGDMWCHISVGAKNKKFQPKTEGLKELLESYVSSVDEAVDTVAKIAQQHLTKLQDELTELPNLFLTTLQEKLQQAPCGEDNVLSEVLSKMLNHVKVFEDTRVDFVAMDHNKLDGKPFCKVCYRKVRFFSILPFVLRNLGLTGKAIRDEKFSDLFDECAKYT